MPAPLRKSRPPRRGLNALANWLAFAAGLVATFALTPALVESLGRERYGAWCVVESALGYLTLLDMGIAVTLVRQAARHRVTGDLAALNRVASCCLLAFGAAGLVALALGLAGVGVLASRGGAGETVAFALVMLVNLTLTLPLSVWGSVLDGLEQYVVKSVVKVAATLCRTVVMLYLAWRGASLGEFGAAVAVASLAEQLAYVVLAHYYLPGLRFSPRRIDRDTFRLVRRSSLDGFAAMLAGRVTGLTATVLIGFVLGAGAAGVFANAARLVDYAKLLLRSAAATLTPGISALEAAGDDAGVRRLYLSATRYILYLALPLQLGLMWFGPAFLTRWLGPEAGGECGPLARVLAVPFGLSLAQSVAARVLYGLGQLRTFAKLTLVEAGLHVAMASVLVNVAGLEGVAWGVALPNALASVLILAWTWRLLGLGRRDFAGAAWRPAAVAAVMGAGWLAQGEPAADWWAILRTGLLGALPGVLVGLGLEWGAKARRPRRRGLFAPRNTAPSRTAGFRSQSLK